MVFEFERLEALSTSESSFLDTHRSAIVPSSSGGNGISRHLARPTVVTSSGHSVDVVLGFH